MGVPEEDLQGPCASASPDTMQALLKPACTLPMQAPWACPPIAPKRQKAIAFASAGDLPAKEPLANQEPELEGSGIARVIKRYVAMVNAGIAHEAALQATAALEGSDIASEQVKQVKASLEELGQKLDRMSERLGQKLDRMSERLDQRLEGMFERLDQRLEGMFEKLDRRFEKLEAGFSRQQATTNVILLLLIFLLFTGGV